jgi:ligand-binding sensor domain-containing protein/signal transduction histidine kinase
MSWALALFLPWAIAQGAELPPAQPVLADLRSEYSVDPWETAEGDKGLPQNSVVSIAQTHDGYLWLGTFNGLVRFDGVRFVVFDAINTPELASSRITFVYADRSGALWIVSEFGDVARFAAGHFTRFTALDGVPPHGASTMSEDAAGDLWLASSRNEGCFRFEKGRFVLRMPPNPETSAGINGFALADDGILWGNQNSVLVPIKPGESSEHFRLSPNLAKPLIDASGVDPAEALQWKTATPGKTGVWIASGDGARKLLGGRWARVLITPVLLGSISRIYEDRDGNVWLGTWRDGLARFDPQGGFQRFRLTSSPVPESIRCITQDTEGNLWIGTDGAGLYRVKPRAFKTYGASDGLNSKVVKSVTQDRDGTIWVVNGEAVTLLPNQQPPGVNPANLRLSGAWCSLVDREGTGWIGTFGSGLVRYRNQIPFTYIPTSRTTGTVLALFQDRKGILWVGRADGLVQVDGDTLLKIEPPPSLKNMDVRALAEDRTGQLYVGLNGEGVLRYADGQWTRFSRNDGLVDDHVWSLYVDAEDTVWIGTYGSGLSRLKGGKVFNFSRGPSRLPGIITSILEDDNGNLWLGSNRGVCRVKRRELNELADGGHAGPTLGNYGTADGLGTTECASGLQPSAWKARDGRLWFATVAGVSVVDPSHLPVNPIPPPVAIEEVVVDDQPVARGLENVAVAPGKHRLEIHFTALSFTAPDQVRFKYQLEGWDPDWIETGGRRTAYFTSVDPGEYRFRVIACNNDGVWNETGAALGVIMLPFFWQTAWFQILSGVALLGGVAGLARFVAVRKMRTELERLQRQNAVNQERTRIARDMHDDLGANLTQISFLSDLAGKEGQPPDRVKQDLQELSGLAQEVVRHLDELVWVVNPDHDQTASFVDYLGAYSEDYLRVRGIACRFDFPSDLARLTLDSNTRHQFFLAYKEVLNNVLKHAAATEVTLQARIDHGLLRVNVRDNGRGFDPMGSSAFSNGLTNLRQRLAALNGKCAFHSAPGQGTDVQLELPVGAAAQVKPRPNGL